MTFWMCNEIQRVKITTFRHLSISLSLSQFPIVNLETSVNIWVLNINQVLEKNELELNRFKYNNIYDCIVEMKSSGLVVSHRRFRKILSFLFLV